MALKRPAITVDDETTSWSDHIIGPMPRGSWPRTAEAAFLQMPIRNLPDALVLAASTVYYGTRLFVGSLLSSYRQWLAESSYEPICTALSGAYDATPIWTRVAEHSAARFPTEQAPS